MKTKIFTIIGLLVSFGVVSDLEAASAAAAKKYSFSEMLEESYLQAPGREKLRERIAILVDCGVVVQDEGHYKLLTKYPLRLVEASVGQGFSYSTQDQAAAFHAHGDSWPEPDLQKFFMDGFVQSILYEYVSAGNAVDRFPFFPINFFTINQKTLQIIKPRLIGWQALADNPAKWWKDCYLPVFKGGKPAKFIDGDLFKNFLEFGEVEKPKGGGHEWRILVLRTLKTEIGGNSDFCRWGAAYLRSKILEEKMLYADDFSDLELKKTFINQITIVMNSLTSCVNNFVRFAMYHRFLGLPVEGATTDAFVQMGGHGSFDRSVARLQELHEQVKAKLGLA